MLWSVLLVLLRVVATLGCVRGGDCLSGMCSTGACQEPIVIDGLFDDWEDAHVRQEASIFEGNGTEILNVSIVLSTNATTYLRWSLASPFNDTAHSFLAMFDTDLNESTGYSWRGSDVFVDANGARTYLGDGSVWLWSDPVGGAAVASSADGLQMEMSATGIARAITRVVIFLTEQPDGAILEAVPALYFGFHVAIPEPRACGDGILHWTEVCDNGDLNAPSSCCDAHCELKIGACDDGLSCTMGDTCRGTECVPELNVCPGPIVIDGLFGDWVAGLERGEIERITRTRTATPPNVIIGIDIQFPSTADASLSVRWRLFEAFNTSFVYQLFLNTDMSATTGFAPNGYDVLIENDRVLSYNGDGSSFSWLSQNLASFALSSDFQQTEMQFNSEGIVPLTSSLEVYAAVYAAGGTIPIDSIAHSLVSATVCGDGVLGLAEYCDAPSLPSRCCSSTCSPTCGLDCVDGVQNFNESDVDCGGSCDPCPLGRLCEIGSDCIGYEIAAADCVDFVCKCTLNCVVTIEEKDSAKAECSALTVGGVCFGTLSIAVVGGMVLLCACLCLVVCCRRSKNDDTDKLDVEDVTKKKDVEQHQGRTAHKSSSEGDLSERDFEQPIDTGELDSSGGGGSVDSLTVTMEESILQRSVMSSAGHKINPNNLSASRLSSIVFSELDSTDSM